MSDASLAGLWGAACEELAARRIDPELAADALDPSKTLEQTAPVMSTLQRASACDAR